MMEYRSDFKYDLKLGQLGEEYLGNLLSNKVIEVKTDLRARETGNVYVEYESRGKPSGLATTEAEWYAFVLSQDKIVLIKTDSLKAICRPYFGTSLDKAGGDKNTSKGITLPICELIT